MDANFTFKNNYVTKFEFFLDLFIHQLKDHPVAADQYLHYLKITSEYKELIDMYRYKELSKYLTLTYIISNYNAFAI